MGSRVSNADVIHNCTEMASLDPLRNIAERTVSANPASRPFHRGALGCRLDHGELARRTRARTGRLCRDESRGEAGLAAPERARRSVLRASRVRNSSATTA